MTTPAKPMSIDAVRNLAMAWCERPDVPSIMARRCANPVEAYIAGFAHGARTERAAVLAGYQDAMASAAVRWFVAEPVCAGCRDQHTDWLGISEQAHADDCVVRAVLAAMRAAEPSE